MCNIILLFALVHEVRVDVASVMPVKKLGTLHFQEKG
jgi:hypothetical protein